MPKWPTEPYASENLIRNSSIAAAVKIKLKGISQLQDSHFRFGDFFNSPDARVSRVVLKWQDVVIESN